MRPTFVSPDRFFTASYSRAPPQILNVQIGQPVELRVARRTNEEYVPPAAGSTRVFSGTGNRLGAPVPPVSGTDQPMPGRFDERGAGSSEPQRLTTRFEVDQSQPTTSIQLRLADGTRRVPLPLKMLPLLTLQSIGLCVE